VTYAQGRDLWRALCDAENTFVRARMQFCGHPENRIAVLREALSVPGQRGTALRVLLHCCIPEEEIRELFQDLVEAASVGHSDIGFARDVILLLPRDWVIANIEQAAEPLLDKGGEEEYRRFLELYDLLDPSLTARLAARALATNDAEIQDVGKDFSG
jgi:hypothetical protein